MYTVDLTLQKVEGVELNLGSWDPNLTTDTALQLSHGARDTLAQFGVRDVVRVALTVQPPFVLWNKVRTALFYTNCVAHIFRRRSDGLGSAWT